MLLTLTKVTFQQPSEPRIEPRGLGWICPPWRDRRPEDPEIWVVRVPPAGQIPVVPARLDKTRQNAIRGCPAEKGIVSTLVPSPIPPVALRLLQKCHPGGWSAPPVLASQNLGFRSRRPSVGVRDHPDGTPGRNDVLLCSFVLCHTQPVPGHATW